MLLRRILFLTPRGISIIASYMAFSFLSEGAQPASEVIRRIGLVVGGLVTLGVIVRFSTNRNWHRLTLLPVGLWSTLFVYYLLGGAGFQINLIQFIYLSVLTGSVTALAWYSWHNYQAGGVIYALLGIFYLLIGINRVPALSLVTVLITMVGTGTMYWFTPQQIDSLQSAHPVKVDLTKPPTTPPKRGWLNASRN